MIDQNMNDTTSSLLSQFVDGNDNAFAKLYDIHINILLNYGYHITQDKDLLKDCIHDIFIKIYSKRVELSNVDNFKSYLFIALKNKIVDEMRKRINLVSTPVEEMSQLSYQETVESEYIKNERSSIEKRRLSHLLSQLSPRQQEAIKLYYMDGKPYEEICDAMSMNYQSVRNLMHRGLAKLRELAV